jgi:PAT family beta-lactamase induction signal transducer AmpG
MIRKMLNRKMLTILFLGLASGIPLGVVLTVLQAWMTKSGIDLKTVGLAVLVQMPYTWKFVWSPLMDRFVPPFLGRRRGWMLISQVLMIASIVAMGQFDPRQAIITILALATVISFAGASHDIVIDAYRRDVLDESELGFGSAVAVNPETTQECHPYQTSSPAGRWVARICFATMCITSLILSLEPTS